MNEQEAKAFLKEHIIVKVVSDAEAWHDEQEGVQCPMCAAYNLPMGMLGELHHHNCRQCGMWYTSTD